MTTDRNTHKKYSHVANPRAIDFYSDPRVVLFVLRVPFFYATHKNATPTFDVDLCDIKVILDFMSQQVERCAICLEDREEGEVQTTHCGHTFHRGCLREWMRRSSTCPLCRAQLAVARRTRPPARLYYVEEGFYTLDDFENMWMEARRDYLQHRQIEQDRRAMDLLDRVMGWQE